MLNYVRGVKLQILKDILIIKHPNKKLVMGGCQNY